MFAGRNLVIASMHKKEVVIAPAIEGELKVNCFVDDRFDSDVLGTFSGEFKRDTDVLSTLRKKCYKAMELTNCDLSIASEGSFGPHPYIPFVQADDEVLMFLDKKNNIEIVAREVSTITNYNALTVTSIEQLVKFANESLFPSHALILKQGEYLYEEMKKGIHSWDVLVNTFHEWYPKNGHVYVETDMRAMCNPTRMQVIKDATLKLIQKLKSECPKCGMPGFDVVLSKKGLKCSFCGMPTRSISANVLVCKHCNYSEEKVFPFGKYSEEPMFCDFCNP